MPVMGEEEANEFGGGRVVGVDPLINGDKVAEVVKQLQAYLEFIKVSVDTPVQHCMKV